MATEAHFADGAEARKAWAEGLGQCPLCRRYGCRGECGCPCKQCRQGEGSIGACEALAELRELQTAEGRAAARARYHAEFGGVGGDGRPTWGECVAQVERLGVPHVTCAAARRPDDRATQQHAKRWWGHHRTEKPVLVLSGPTQAGKSVAAAFLCARWGEARPWWRGQPSGPSTPEVVWLYAPEVQRLALLREADEALLERCRRARLLVVDDVEGAGAQAGNAAVASLLAYRADDGKPTVITTNGGAQALGAALGAHVVARLARADWPRGPGLAQERRSGPKAGQEASGG